MTGRSSKRVASLSTSEIESSARDARADPKRETKMSAKKNKGGDADVELPQDDLVEQDGVVQAELVGSISDAAEAPVSDVPPETNES
jgi:hypothetical protein